MGFAFKLARLRNRRHQAQTLHNPYLAARHEWDERYGDLVTRAKNWRTMALFRGWLLSSHTGGMLWLSARSRVVPFVVLMDSLGRPLASGMADQASVGDDRLKRAELLSWVENLRLVTTDALRSGKRLIAYTRILRAAVMRKRSSVSTTEQIHPSSAPRRIL